MDRGRPAAGRRRFLRPRRVLGLALVLATVAGVACERHEPPEPRGEDALPGAAPRAPDLAARLDAAAEREAHEGPPRTRHLRPDGSARYTNRLVLERSPYLRQHAHNPVDWYPWGDEAFARAKREGKLILLSVGYATCHWCHVMEEESFEDETIAAAMNADYVAIKVDREERPDVDDTYLRAVTMLTGGGGWPMTIWLTPDRQMFFAGTYFPPRDGARGARMGFLTLLRHFADAYRTTPESVVADGRALTERVRAAGVVAPAADVPERSVLDTAYRQLAAAFDAEHGGFGGAPKFPMPSALDFLLRYHRRTGAAAALAMVQRTLGALADGGVHDQLGGGFHRYATDGAWLVPHFEKMLYDNAQLANLYLATAQATNDDAWRDVARAILDDLVRTLRAPEGAFYAAVDADDPGGEGRYYTWTPAEIDAVLGAAAGASVRAYYGVDAAGNFGGRTVLHVARTFASRGFGIDEPTAAALADARARLRAARATRPAPLVDAKILTGWNGLAISAFARAGAILAEPRYVDVAREAARFVLEHLTAEGRLLRVYAAGGAEQEAFLEDYAFLEAGLLDLYEATSDLRWFAEARTLQATLDRRFWDPEGGGYFESGDARDPALPRAKPAEDGALPSGNAVAAENLVRLATFTDDDAARGRAEACLRAFGRGLTAVPTSAARMLGVVEALLDRPREIVVIAPTSDANGLASLVRVVEDRYLPNRAFVVAYDGAELAAARRALAIVGEKQTIDGRPTAYVCERGRCLAPTSDPAVFARQLGQVTPLPDAVPRGD